jgi:hypothetical protein
MVEDSLSRHLIALKPQIDSLFAKYTLQSVTTGLRLSANSATSPIPYDYFMNVLTSVSTVSPLSLEAIVARVNPFTITIPHPVTTIPDLAILVTSFPFDTIFTGLFDMQMMMPETKTVAVARYGLNFFLGQLSVPIPVDNTIPIKEDFYLSAGSKAYSDIRYPQDTIPKDTSIFLWGQNYNSPCATCTPYVNLDSSYKTHEYRFQIASSILYMKVLAGSKPDSIKVRFDTVSFLSSSIISVAPIKPHFEKVSLGFDKNFMMIHGIENGKLAIYDISGKKLFSCFLNSRNARIALPTLTGAKVFIVKVSTGRDEFIIKKCLMN